MPLHIATVKDDDIKESSDEERKLALSYLKGVFDFAKWTSTIAIAGILWIGSTLSYDTGIGLYLSIASLILIVVSLVIAILAVWRILTSWGLDWKVAREEADLMLVKKLIAFTSASKDPRDRARLSDLKAKEESEINSLIESIDAIKPFSDPAAFRSLITWHIVLLVGSLSLFIFARIFSSVVQL
jgi:hypothetical protein